MYYLNVDTSRTKAPDVKTTTNCRRSFAFHNVLILYTFTGVTGPPSSWWLWLFQISAVANFEAEASLRSFEAFWPGDKHDEKISNCSSTPKLVQTLDSVASLTILPHSHDRSTSNLMVFSEISFWNEMFLYSIKTEMFTVAESWFILLINAGNRKLQETSRRFCETLVGHMFFKCDEMGLTVKTMLVFLEYIFQFFINQALPVSNSVDRQNFKGKKVLKMKFNDVSFSFLLLLFFFGPFVFVFFRKTFSFFDRLKIYR